MSDTFQISYTKLSDYRRCRQRYAWKYVDKYFPPQAIGQLRGECGHAALAVWHTQHDQAAAMEAAWLKWSGVGYEHDSNWTVLELCLTRYMSWSQSNDKFQLLSSEQKFDLLYEEQNVRFIGYIDGVIEDEKGSQWLLENKFLQRADINGTDIDYQSSLYLLAAHLLGYNVRGVLYNVVRVADTKIAVTEPVLRKYVFRNPAGLNVVQDEMLRQTDEMRKGGEIYRNPTKECSWDCAFYSACLSMLDDGQIPTAMLQSIAQTRRK